METNVRPPASAPPGEERAGSHVVRSAERVNAPRPALVEPSFDGTPKRVDREGVELVREEWRVVDRWWTETPVSRRYFEVVLQSGRNTVVFRDQERGGWFSQRC
jgi:hypothetical protein